MSKKPLIETNPYLRDPKKFEESLIISVASSTAIETGRSVKAIIKDLKDHREKRQHTKSVGPKKRR